MKTALFRRNVQYSTQTSNSSEMTILSEYNIEFPLKCTPELEESLCTHSKNETEEDSLFVKIMNAAITGSEANYLEIRSGLGVFPDVIHRQDKFEGAATPLHYASIKGHEYTVLFFLENGAKANVWDKDEQVTPLNCAAAHGNLETVKALLKHDADVNAGLDSLRQCSSLLWAVRNGHTDVVRYLLKHNASQNSPVMYSETPIHAACLRGSPEILEILIRAKGKASLCMDVAVKNTPLHIAGSGDNANGLECCKILLEKGNVQVDPKNLLGQTPLHLAAGEWYDPDIVQYLVNHKADVNARDNKGRSPIFYAVSDDPYALKCIQVLVNSKCHVDLKDEAGHTALHLAAIKDKAGAAEELLMSGADFSLKADGGVSALSLLLRKIPNTPEILGKVFDRAIDLTQYENESNLNAKIKVNYRYIASPSTESIKSSTKKETKGGLGTDQQKGYGTSDSFQEHESSQVMMVCQPETAKVKCLVDEKQGNLLLHPLVHTFLSMKYKKASPFFYFIAAFKVFLAILFSVYVLLPFLYGKTISKPASNSTKLVPFTLGLDATNNETKMPFVLSNNSQILPTSKPTEDETVNVGGNVEDKEPVPREFVLMHLIIVTLAILHSIMEVTAFLKAPKSQWIAFEPLIFVIVVVIMIVYMMPDTWGKTLSTLHRSMAALGILLTWIDVWIYIGRFPKYGLSIRVYFTVLHNFLTFLIPHAFLFLGFCIAFALLFSENPEFFDPTLGITKMVRIMAGDITIVTEGTADFIKNFPMFGKGFNDTVAGYLLIYIYTAYVLMVPIVMMNLLIGLASNDTQAIYALATEHRLTKVAILLHTLESSFTGKWTRAWATRGFISKYITLFPQDGAIRTFKPYDSRDTKMDDEMKKVLKEIEKTRAQSDETYSVKPSPNEVQKGLKDKKLLKKIDDLVEKVAVLMAKLEDKDNRLSDRMQEKKSS